MTEAPKRIWVWDNEPSGELVASFPDQPYPIGATEYVRADLARTVAEAAKVLLAEQSRIRTARLKGWRDNDGYIVRLDPDVLRALSHEGGE